MLLPLREPSVYSRAERLSDAALHVTGVIGALVAAPIIIILAAVWFGDAGTVTAAAVYGGSLFAMLTCSAVYHMAPLPAWKDWLRRMDQSAIYVKIAGTFTPFAVLAGSSTGLFLAGLWSAALAGAAMILFGPTGIKWPSLILYLAIGWVGVAAGQPMIAALSAPGFALIVIGGLLYTIGVIFFLWERLPFHNTIWHGFVLVATAIFYAAVLVELWGRSGAI